MNNNKEIENEKDVEIITLLDSQIQIFQPPSTIGLTSNYMCPKTPNLNITSNSLFDPERTNFTFTSKIEYLGVGGFSKVYKYKGDLENKAVKKIFADPKYYSKKLTAEDSIKREVFGMKKVNCANSLKIYGVYQNTEKNTYYLLMELCDGNMEKFVKERGYPLNIYEIFNLLNQLNNAFYLLEINNIIHRDIKPSNILYKEVKDIDPHNKRVNRKLFDGRNLIFKLGDYGVCLPLYDKNYSKSQFMGTLDFMAPEIYEMKCEKEHPIYTKKIDLFSLGQTILCLMGYIKKASALNKTMIKQLRENCNLFNGNRREKMLADLIFNNLLIIDPEKRAGWDTYFNHPLFEDNYFGSQNGNKEENVVRIAKRMIKRNSIDSYKIEIPKNIKLYKYSKKTENVEEKSRNKNNIINIYDKTNEKIFMNNMLENTNEKDNSLLYVKNKSNPNINKSNRNDNENTTNYGKIKNTSNISDKITDKENNNFIHNKIKNIINNSKTTDENYNLNKNKKKESTKIKNIEKTKSNDVKNIIFSKNKNDKEIQNIIIYNKTQNINNINLNNNDIKSIKLKYINKNNDKILDLERYPFDLEDCMFEKKKTFTSQKVRSLIANKDIHAQSSAVNKKNNINKYNNEKKNEKINRIIVINKSPSYFIRNKNKSNISGNLFNPDKSFETHNHFYSVRSKYKKLAFNKDKDKNDLIHLTHINLGPKMKDINVKKNKNVNISQNISSKNLNIIEETSYILENGGKNDSYEEKTNRYPRDNIKNKIKLKMNLLPNNRTTKSQIKYNISKKFNTKNDIALFQPGHKNIISTNLNPYNISINEVIPKDNKRKDIKDDKNKYNKISYILNSTNAKNKSITYFNIRVINNTVEENINKINKNNAFYFSKYSRYKHNN